jgi:tRNA(fMet)-specific endonuclease VapC
VPTIYFLDTNILVHLIRRDALGQYLINNYSLYSLDPRPLISDVTEGELRSLAIQWKWGQHKIGQMEFVLSYFWRIAINTPDVFEAYAAIDAFSESIGISMGKNDVWIAAAVQTLQALLLTTDKDFDHLHPIYISRDWIDPSLFKAK